MKTTKACRIALVLVATSLWASAAHADFFNDVKRTFQTDVPHFFQDDIPCAFGGQPTSHTTTSCKPQRQAVPNRAGDATTAPLQGEAPEQRTSPAPFQPPVSPRPVQY